MTGAARRGHRRGTRLDGPPTRPRRRPAMTDLKTGILLWSQAATWPEMLDAAQAGRPARATTTSGRGTTCTRSSATRTSRSSRAGPRSRPGRWRPRRRAWACSSGRTRSAIPGLAAKIAGTLDHISDGRAILGIGGAWMELEHQAHGIEFGSGFGQRLDWLDESVGAMRAVLDGGSATSRARRRTTPSTTSATSPSRSRSGCRS